MSDFSPGFVSRHHAPEQAMERAFASPIGFAPSRLEVIGRRVPAEASASPRHFAPANPGANPTEGWDPFDAANQAEEGFVDPIAAAHSTGFDAGRAAGMAEMGPARAEEARLIEQLTAALQAASNFDREQIADRLRRTVLFLVTKTIGEIGVSADLLNARIDAAADMLADKAESALLRLHPDDVVLVDGKLPGNVFAVADPHVARGAFVIESASTIVEDGPELWLEQLAHALETVAIPPAC